MSGVPPLLGSADPGLALPAGAAPLAGAGGFALFVVVLILFGVVSTIVSALKRAWQASEARFADSAGRGPDARDRQEGAARSPLWDAAPDPRTATSARTARAPAVEERPRRSVRARRTSLVDAHVSLDSHLPTSDDMPGAHAAHDHRHLADIEDGDDLDASRPLGARRSKAKEPRAARAKMPAPDARPFDERALRRSASSVLRLDAPSPRDRVRAGFLWSVVLGPPRSRERSRR